MDTNNLRYRAGVGNYIRLCAFLWFSRARFESKKTNFKQILVGRMWPTGCFYASQQMVFVATEPMLLLANLELNMSTIKTEQTTTILHTRLPYL